MIVFAAGNKYEVLNCYEKFGEYYIYGRKMIKSTGKFPRSVNTYNVGRIEPVEIKEEA